MVQGSHAGTMHGGLGQWVKRKLQPCLSEGVRHGWPLRPLRKLRETQSGGLTVKDRSCSGKQGVWGRALGPGVDPLGGGS